MREELEYILQDGRRIRRGVDKGQGLPLLLDQRMWYLDFGQLKVL